MLRRGHAQQADVHVHNQVKLKQCTAMTGAGVNNDGKTQVLPTSKTNNKWHGADVKVTDDKLFLAR